MRRCCDSCVEIVENGEPVHRVVCFSHTFSGFTQQRLFDRAVGLGTRSSAMITSWVQNIMQAKNNIDAASLSKVFEITLPEV